MPGLGLGFWRQIAVRLGVPLPVALISLANVPANALTIGGAPLTLGNVILTIGD